MNLLIFAGTSEGSEFSRLALSSGHRITVSLATAYGAGLLTRELALTDEQAGLCSIRWGRLDADGMVALCRQDKDKNCIFDAVVDATHPYAQEASRQIREACSRLSLPCYRLRRPVQDETVPGLVIRRFSSVQEAAGALAADASSGRLPPEKPLFLATGSKELAAFTAEPRLRDRLLARVLPSEESIALCSRAGIPPERIVAMQGAFSRELNAALFKEYDCCALVTKQSGETGGYREKLLAAANAGIPVYVVMPPEEEPGQAVFSDAKTLLLSLDDRSFFGALMAVLESGAGA